MISFSIRDLLEAGIHFGHRKNFWNPKMAEYIHGVRNGIHIIDLDKTHRFMKEALQRMKDVASKNGKILFVGTKKQASDIIAAQAKRCGQYYVNYRWLGGMLTNWSTVSNSIKTLKKYEDRLANPNIDLTKKERLDLERKRQKLDDVLGGIRNMGGRPDLIFVIDTNMEKLAITEARSLGIPVIGVVDTNSNPDSVNYIIPGNDDARKAIEFYTSFASEAILAGLQESLSNSGVDLGSIEIDFSAEDIDLGINPEDFKEKEGAKKTRGATVVKKKSAKKTDDAAEVAASSEA